MKKLLCICLLVLTGCPAKTPILPIQDLTTVSRVIGQDHLALQHKEYKVKQLIKYTPKGGATGHLDITFGSKLKKVRKLLEGVQPSIHRVHIINATCVRNGVCQPYETGYGYNINSFNQAIFNKNPKIFKELKTRTKLYRDLSTEFPNTKFLLSPVLEHDLSTDSWRNLANAVLQVWPTVQLVNSPNMGKSSEQYKGAWIERHGKDPGNVHGNSLDGEEGTDINVPDWLERTDTEKYTLSWSRVNNCRTNSAEFEAPKDRTACPTAGNFEELAHLTDVRPPKPQFQGSGLCIGKNSFDPPNIWKPMADMHYPWEPRSNYPVAIIKMTSSTVDVIAVDGSKVGTLVNQGSYDSPGYAGYYRFYSDVPGGSSLNGYGFEKKAMNHGSPWVWLKGNDCVGPFVPGRRAGVYR